MRNADDPLNGHSAAAALVPTCHGTTDVRKMVLERHHTVFRIHVSFEKL